MKTKYHNFCDKDLSLSSFLIQRKSGIPKVMQVLFKSDPEFMEFISILLNAELGHRPDLNIAETGSEHRFCCSK